MISLLLKLLGDPNERKVKSIMGIIDHINALEPQFAAMSDAELIVNRSSISTIHSTQWTNIKWSKE